jgi:hypothetical protein
MVIRATIAGRTASPGLASEESAVEQNASDLLSLAMAVLIVLALPVAIGLVAALRENGDS